MPIKNVNVNLGYSYSYIIFRTGEVTRIFTFKWVVEFNNRKQVLRGIKIDTQESMQCKYVLLKLFKSEIQVFDHSMKHMSGTVL
jgi:hypothetical protein